MKKALFLLLVIFRFVAESSAMGQDTIRLKVKVEDVDNPGIWINFYAVNRRTKVGTFGDRWAEFDMLVRKTDTIIVNAKGYVPRIFCMKDSTWAAFKMFTVKLEREVQLLPEATVIAIRDLTEIEKDIKRLEVKKTSAYSDYISLQSPITAMYERFSKLAQQKQKAAALEYEDRKRELLKELLAKYVKGDIIVLSESEFDDFLNFCNVNMDFIQKASQYELIMFFKTRYEEYSKFVKKVATN